MTSVKIHAILETILTFNQEVHKRSLIKVKIDLKKRQQLQDNDVTILMNYLLNFFSTDFADHRF